MSQNGFRQVTPRLPVRVLEETIAFYRDHLGFEVEVLWPDADPTFTILRKDATRVGFFVGTEHQPGDIGYAELYIDVLDVKVLHADLRARVPVEWGPEVYSYGRREFAVKDPNGYLLIFTEETEDAPPTPEPL